MALLSSAQTIHLLTTVAPSNLSLSYVVYSSKASQPQPITNYVLKLILSNQHPSDSAHQNLTTVSSALILTCILSILTDRMQDAQQADEERAGAQKAKLHN